MSEAWITGYLIPTLRRQEAELLDDLERIRAARAILDGLEPDLEPEPAPPPPPRVVRLDAPARTPITVREAAADDVLAAVARLGLDRPAAIADYLRVGVPTVLRRLVELRRQGLVSRAPGHGPGRWRPTLEAQGMTWLDYRARELATYGPTDDRRQGATPRS